MKNIQLNTKEVELINEACEFFMDQLKMDHQEGQNWEKSNNKKFYDLWDIRNKVKRKHHYSIVDAYIEMGLHSVAKNKFDCDGYYDLNEDQREACKQKLINWVESK